MNTTYSTDSAQRTAGMFSGQTYQGGVLVVDDEPDIRKVVRMTLEKLAGFKFQVQRVTDDGVE